MNANVTLAYSSTGNSWTTVASSSVDPFSGGKCTNVIYDSDIEIWVANGILDDNKLVAFSTDGMIWSLYGVGSDIFSGGECNAVAWNGSIWVAGGKNFNSSVTIAYSKDGLNWIAATNGFNLDNVSKSIRKNNY